MTILNFNGEKHKLTTVSNVIELKDPYSYLLDNDNSIIGVAFQSGHEYIGIENTEDGINVVTLGSSRICKHELKQLMVMWLAINYPDILKFDDD